MNFELFKEMLDDEKRESLRRAERIQEEGQSNNNHLQLLEAAAQLASMIDDLKDEVARQQSEIDELNEQVEQKDAEITEWRQRLLETENQQLEAEVKAKPMEIHNHFESGSNSQVFNDKVRGRFDSKKNEKRTIYGDTKI